MFPLSGVLNCKTQYVIYSKNEMCFLFIKYNNALHHILLTLIEIKYTLHANYCSSTLNASCMHIHAHIHARTHSHAHTRRHGTCIIKAFSRRYRMWICDCDPFPSRRHRRIACGAALQKSEWKEWMKTQADDKNKWRLFFSSSYCHDPLLTQ